MADSSSLSNHFKYDVFISFRGEDTRKTFVDHLYAALSQREITTYKDDDEVKSKALCKEIEESRFAIVIFSKSYASSSWCLDELVKIMECSKEKGQLVLPVYYYDFKPSNLRRQGSDFGELYSKYEMEKVKAWVSALVEAANLNGLGLSDYSSQAKHIKEIVEIVLSKLFVNKLNYDQNAMGKMQDKLGDTTSSHEPLIGINRRVQQVKALLRVKTASKPVLASSSPRSSQWTYDVFMSFKVNDTCTDFVDHLYLALKQHNISAFRNDQALARVRSIDSEQLRVIEESYIAVVVFSENYAASNCCLDELVKIMSCNERIRQMVFPIFFNVDSFDVRYQKGHFGEAFVRNNPEKVETWRKALVEACSLAGWYLNCASKSDEATVIESVIDVISRRLDWLPSVEHNLIGVDARLKRLRSLLKLESGGVRMIGICGMGGCGKTTLARAIYDQISNRFDSSCFVENVREISRKQGLKHIQREMLSRLLKDENLLVSSNYESDDPIKHRLVRRKVLVVLDDVDDFNQLEALGALHSRFGEGSRIIVTTRDAHLLAEYNIMQTYNVKPLDYKESYQLFTSRAFKKGHSTMAYEDLLPQVVSYAAGLPLALKVLGSLLRGRSKKEWTSTLARLQVSPEKAIQDTLRMSYDSLKAHEKELFLDIACLFKDAEKDYVVNILDSCGFSGDKGIRVLEDKSLIRISKGRIKIHSLLQQMATEIVRQMQPDEPSKHSRVWRAEDVHHMLMDSKSMKEVNAIVVDDMHDYDYDAVDMTKALKGLKNLKLLQIQGHNKLRFPEESNYLPKNLRWLTLENYSLPSLPKSFKLKKLVALELRHSSLSELWHGAKDLPNLSLIDLSFSTKLIKTPDFTTLPKLEVIKLEYCTSLTEVHPSVGHLNKLSVISMRSCTKLETLPQSMLNLQSLKILDVSGCLNLNLPRLLENLHVYSDSRIPKVPGPVRFLCNLVALDLSNVVDLDLRMFWNVSLPSLHNLARIVLGRRSHRGETSQEMVVL